jgi:hypothetical protein
MMPPGLRDVNGQEIASDLATTHSAITLPFEGGLLDENDCRPRKSLACPRSFVVFVLHQGSAFGILTESVTGSLAGLGCCLVKPDERPMS